MEVIRSSAVREELQGDVQQFCCSRSARQGVPLHAVKGDGAWGRADYGGDSSAVREELQGDVQQFCCSRSARQGVPLHAVKGDGAWGRADYGGDSSAVREELQGDVRQLVSPMRRENARRFLFLKPPGGLKEASRRHHENKNFTGVQPPPKKFYLGENLKGFQGAKFLYGEILIRGTECNSVAT